MYTQVFDPVGDSLFASAIFAALALLTLFILLGALKVQARFAALAALLVACAPEAPPKEKNVVQALIPLAVMGDSDSHSYQDRIWLPPGDDEPGGPYRAQTFQWTEVLAQLRGTQLGGGGGDRPSRHRARRGG